MMGCARSAAILADESARSTILPILAVPCI
jgi:hypothetical protein